MPFASSSITIDDAEKSRLVRDLTVSSSSSRQLRLPCSRRACAPFKALKRLIKACLSFFSCSKKRRAFCEDSMVLMSLGVGEASIYHAVIVIFLEFFAWGLLTSPMISVLNDTFPEHTFLMNGLIVGIKGLLSFLAAPLIGALSDLWGRKLFLLLTVFCTCAPIPLMKINTWWYFATMSLSGTFAVTFSVVFAYVADVTTPADRAAAYGLVSATFAASLITSPALGAYLEQVYSEDVVVAVATAVAILDVFFILVAVPESLPSVCDNLDHESGSLADKRVLSLPSLEQVDPFASLRKMWKDSTILMLCLAVFLSYLPEAGQYSCFFVYLRLVMSFSKEEVALFIAAVGLMSVVAQTGLLTVLMRTLGSKHTIMVGLFFEMLQLIWYGFGSQTWMMWAAGGLASIASITYPAISSFVSMHASADQQGLVQGMVTGIRGLCNGLGPAVFGLIFSLFKVDLTEPAEKEDHFAISNINGSMSTSIVTEDDLTLALVKDLIPGPPFVFGAFLVMLALMVAAFIPDSLRGNAGMAPTNRWRRIRSDQTPAMVHSRRRLRSGKRRIFAKLSDEDERQEELVYAFVGSDTDTDDNSADTGARAKERALLIK